MDLILRPTTMDDAHDVLAWRNDPQTREASIHTEEIDTDTHIAWFRNVIDDENRNLYIAMMGDEKVGSIRADLTDGVYELSWMVAPSCRGQGIGKKLLLGVMEVLEGRFRAVIKKDNIASMRIAETAGMMLEREHEGVLYYTKN